MLDNAALDTLFRSARTHNGWQNRPVTDDQLQQIYDLMKMGPTSANCSPARIVFIRSAEAKARLKPALSPGKLDKTMEAPGVEIIAHEPKLLDPLPKPFPPQHVHQKERVTGKNVV